MEERSNDLKFICRAIIAAALFVFAITVFGCMPNGNYLETHIPKEHMDAVWDRRSSSDGLDKIIVDMPGYEIDFAVHQDYNGVALTLSNEDKASSSKTVKCNGEGKPSFLFFGKQGVSVEFENSTQNEAVVSAVIRKGERIAGYAVFAFGVQADGKYLQTGPRVIKAVLFDADLNGYPEPSLKSVNHLIDRAIDQAVEDGILSENA